MVNPPVPAPMADGDVAQEAARLVGEITAQLPTPVPGERAAAVLGRSDRKKLAFRNALRGEGGFEFGSELLAQQAFGASARAVGDATARAAERLPSLLDENYRLAYRTAALVAPGASFATAALSLRLTRGLFEPLLLPTRVADSAPRYAVALSPAGPGGRKAAAEYLDGLHALLERSDVADLIVDLDALSAGASLWAFDSLLDSLGEHIGELLTAAAAKPRVPNVTLQVKSFAGLALGQALAAALLADPELAHLGFTFTVPTALPDALDAVQVLAEQAKARTATGGAAIEVRILSGAAVVSESASAENAGWPLASYEATTQLATNTLRVLDWVLREQHTAALRVRLAGNGLHDYAWALVLAEQRGVLSKLTLEVPGFVSNGIYDALATANEARILCRVSTGLDGSLAGALPAVAHELALLFQSGGPDAYDFDGVQARADLALRGLLDAVAALDDGGPSGLAPLSLRTQDRLAEMEEEATRAFSGLAVTATDDGRAAATRASVEAVSVLAGPDEGVGVKPVPEQPDADHDPHATTVAPRLNYSLPSVDAAPVGRADAAAETTAYDRGELGGGPAGFADTAAFRESLFRSTQALDPQLTGAVIGISRGRQASMGGGDPFSEFAKTSLTDPAIAANRRWARSVIAKVATSDAGHDTLVATRVLDDAALESLVSTARDAGVRWAATSATERSGLLRRVARAISESRSRLAEVLIPELAYTLPEADAAVSALVDYAIYYAIATEQLELVQGAKFRPAPLTLVAPALEFPEPAELVLAALAAGSAVVMMPGARARRSLAVFAETLWSAGVSKQTLSLATSEEDAFEERLVSDPRFDRVLLAGDREQAKRYKAWRPGVGLFGSVGGKNAIVVTPAADPYVAARFIVESAFQRGGQQRTAASLAILVGGAGKHEQLLECLADLAASIRTGEPSALTTRLGPLIAEPDPLLEHALEDLGLGESWLLEPHKLDGSRRRYSPGIRLGVTPGSFLHLAEYFGPVLGIMHARSLPEALEYQNAVGGAVTAGICSFDPEELSTWIDGVQAGSLFINTAIAPGVGRQPLGGFGQSAVGVGAKRGGPNTLITLGDWVPDPAPASASLHLRGVADRVRAIVAATQEHIEYETFDWLRKAVLSDAVAYSAEFGVVRDSADLVTERNLQRYLPTPTVVRAGVGVELATVVRVLAAGILARAQLALSVAETLPEGVVEELEAAHISVTVEDEADWLERLTQDGVRLGDKVAPRLRILDADDAKASARKVAQVLPDPLATAIFAGEVTPAGRIELLPFLREQSITVPRHFYGLLVDPSRNII